MKKLCAKYEKRLTLFTVADFLYVNFVILLMDLTAKIISTLSLARDLGLTGIIFFLEFCKAFFYRKRFVREPLYKFFK